MQISCGYHLQTSDAFACTTVSGTKCVVFVCPSVCLSICLFAVVLVLSCAWQCIPLSLRRPPTWSSLVLIKQIATRLGKLPSIVFQLSMRTLCEAATVSNDLLQLMTTCWLVPRQRRTFSRGRLLVCLHTALCAASERVLLSVILCYDDNLSC